MLRLHMNHTNFRRLQTIGKGEKALELERIHPICRSRTAHNDSRLGGWVELTEDNAALS